MASSFLSPPKVSRVTNGLARSLSVEFGVGAGNDDSDKDRKMPPGWLSRPSVKEAAAMQKITP